MALEDLNSCPFNFREVVKRESRRLEGKCFAFFTKKSLTLLFFSEFNSFNISLY